jgi:hypothetical protein
VPLVDQLRILLVLACACWSCGRSRNATTGGLLDLRIDHDHRLGLVRGALCDGCNQALGRLRECERTIASAAAYLETPPLPLGELLYRRPFPEQEKRDLAGAAPRCQICERRAKLDELVVDHDHRTGWVRGLSCESCNLALGHLGESASRVRALAGYWRRCETLVAASGRSEERMQAEAAGQRIKLATGILDCLRFCWTLPLDFDVPRLSRVSLIAPSNANDLARAFLAEMGRTPGIAGDGLVPGDLLRPVHEFVAASSD